MDFLESTKVVFQRIEKIEPENVFKIMGCLLLKDHGELEMIRLAFSPQRVLQNLIEAIKLELESTPKPTISAHVPALPLVKKSLVAKVLKHFTPSSSLPPMVSAARLPLNGLWIPVMPKAQQLTPMVWHDSAAVEYSLQYQFGSYNMDASCYPMQTYYYQMYRPTGPQPSLLSDFARPACGSFMQGYCKYGGSYWFLHIFQLQNGDYVVVNPPTTLDEILSNGSLKLLELELIELLKSRRGIPVSVSSLPILYFDHYEKMLHIEGYLWENHRQRFVCRMIQLLARMTRSICLTNRPHGRQSMILAEDYYKYGELGEERNEHEVQVYLTFPSESSFADQEVYNYFYNFGPVQEIRIPSQMRRMFGFVTFVFPETAALVLSKTNPHYICGEQVLVKPYQLRRTLFERSNMGKVHHQINNDKDIPELPNDLEDHEQPVELETKRSLETEAVSVGQASNESSF